MKFILTFLFLVLLLWPTGGQAKKIKYNNKPYIIETEVQFNTDLPKLPHWPPQSLWLTWGKPYNLKTLLKEK